ncbi:MAG: DNA/RNA nuclease SfsA [Oscillospiraceae bacterium]|nr:DNA/RNA nuclease SfsA [Oscillospiraceae bacterium]
MIYDNVYTGKFLARPNRFIAHIEVDGKTEICHVKNTGRCKELLTPNATVYVQHFDTKARKTNWDLIAVQKGERLINMDSQAPNKAVGEWLLAGGLGQMPTLLKPECTHGDSRFDFYIETSAQRAFMEVKGVTLEENGVVRFPDAPTQRGTKHINGLIQCVKQGFNAYILFVVQMENVTCFTPNHITDPAFANALKQAKNAGVTLLCYDCTVTNNSMVLKKAVPIRL